jgi:DNA polymerase II large subunit
MIKITARKDVSQYFEKLTEKINNQVDIAKDARKTGRDIDTDIETFPAQGIAEKTEILVGPKGVSKIYHELWEVHNHDRFKVTLDIFNQILDGTLGGIEDPEKRLEQAIRTALVIQTDGVVVSPLDGLPEIKISTNPDGSKYPDIYFAGPIRAAGGNAQTLPVLLADLARKKLHLDRYKPSKQEVDRLIEENMIYQSDVVVRQQRVTEDEIRVIAENCPVCINSGPDSDVELMVNRDLERIKTNRVRGAMCLVMIDGVYVRAMKILKTSKILGLDWSWLEKLIKVKKTSEGSFELKPSTKYLEGLAAGRPVFSYPLVPGGFRLRYGKTRTTGLMAKAINPATMYILEEFVAVGTHGRIERPGKSLQYFPCDSIEGPIVRLKNKDVIKINNVKEALKNRDSIEKILFLGDILINVGDFKKSGHPLIKAGYVEEEWLSEMKYLLRKEEITEDDFEELYQFYKNPDPYKAISLSLKHKVSLYPKYIVYYSLLDNEELKILVDKFRTAEKIFLEDRIIGAKIKTNNVIKSILEKIGVEHKYLLEENKIILEKEIAYPFLKTLGALNATNPLEEFKEVLEDKQKTIVEKLTIISKLKINEKAGSFIGARMGRPEAAHERILPGKSATIFPVGEGFGNNRDLLKTIDSKKNYSGSMDIKVKGYQCESCKKIMFTSYCTDCNQRTKELYECNSCKKISFNKTCPVCNEEGRAKINNKVNLDDLIKKAIENLGVGVPETLKGFKELASQEKYTEALEKGILRSKHGLYVFRDGTIRYEALNATITQFKPKELNLSVEKVKELGYVIDYQGKEIKDENQIIDIFPQDIIISDHTAEYFLKITKFVDDLLEKFYKKEKYFNFKEKEELIGELVIGLAPHTSAGIVGRILGFSKARLCFGHPFFITAKRRNVDGDQDSIMLLMDALLNFSPKYLSKGRGGRMDAPIAFTTVVNPYEIDDECYEIETATEYPFEFYQNSKRFLDADDKNLKYVSDFLGTEDQYTCMKFTHDTSIFDEGPKMSTYLTIKSMQDKVTKQAELQKKIRAVDNKDALERLLHYHLFPDIIGNTRAFARQGLRCIKCNSKYRRIPLSGICLNCSGKLVMTIHEGSIKKYLEIAKNLIKKYELKPYLYQKVILAEEDINSLFVDKEEMKQKSLSNFF